MPSGEVHHEYWKMGIVPAFVLNTLLCIGLAFSFKRIDYPIELWIWSNLSYLAGRYVDPDLDILGVNAAEGRATRELDLLGVFFFGYSSFYAALMNYLARKFKIRGVIGAHRSWLTHGPIGTVIRIIWINTPLIYLKGLSNELLLLTIGGSISFARMDLLVFLFGQLIGLGEADSIHVVLDMRYSED